MPNLIEQAALERGRAMQADGESLRNIALVWVKDFGLNLYDAKSVQRVLDRNRMKIETVA